MEFGDDVASAVLMSDILLNATTSPIPACLSLELGASSPVVGVTVSVAPSPDNLNSTSSQYVLSRLCQPKRPCHWEGDVAVAAGDRVFITASKVRVTRGAVTFAFVANVSLTPGRCSAYANISKFAYYTYYE